MYHHSPNRLIQNKELALHWGQQASSHITQQFRAAWQNIDFSQPQWTQLAIATLLIALPTGISLAAFRVIATPSQPRCNQPPRFQADFAKLQCLHQAMQSKEQSSFINALQQLQNWSSDSPVYSVSQHLLEDWSVVALSMAQEEFEAGRWDNAMRLAAAIPTSLELSNQAKERLSLWETIQGQGNKIYDLAIEALEKQDWTTAHSHAKTLANLGNDYWRQQGIQMLPEQIKLARQAQQPPAPGDFQRTTSTHASLLPRGHGRNPRRSQPALPGRSRIAMPLISLKKLAVGEPSSTKPEFSITA